MSDSFSVSSLLNGTYFDELASESLAPQEAEGDTDSGFRSRMTMLPELPELPELPALPEPQPVTVAHLPAALAAENSAPQIGAVAPVTFLENDVRAAPHLLMPNTTFHDAEDNFAGGTVLLSGLLAEDHVAIRSQGSDAGEIGVSGNSVSYGGVVIGSFAGGDGAAFTVTFNDAATSAAVEALLRNLTYANDSHSPTATRTLGVQVTDSAGADLGRGPAVIAPISIGATPYDVGTPTDNLDPEFVDLNGDGRLDMLVGDRDGMVNAYIRNPNDTVTKLEGAANPFNGIDFGNFASLSSNDFDGDGKLDIVVTSQNTSFRTFHNNGGGSFTELTGAANPLAGAYFSNYAEVSFIDVDSDGDNDMVFTSFNEGFSYYRNDGGVFYARTGADNPFAQFGTNMQGNTTLDVDGDGKLDIVVENGDPLVVLHNNGDGSFAMLSGAGNPFVGIATDGWLLQSVDFDGDGDLDIVHGATTAGLAALRNDSSNGEPLVVTITRQNDAPEGVDRTVTLIEDGTAVLGTAAFAFDDAEGNALVEVRVDTLPLAGTLYLTTGGNPAAVTAGQWISAADIAAGHLSFVPAANANGAGYASFTYQVRDDGGTADGGIDVDPTPNTITLDVTPVYDQHTLTGVPASLSILENIANTTPQLLMPAAVFSDADNGFAGGTVTIKGLLAEDHVTIRNQGVGAGEIGASGSSVTFGGVAIGSFTGGTGNDFTLTFNGAATSAAIEAALRNLAYDDPSNTPTATRSLVVQVTDAAGHDLGHAAPAFSGGSNPFSIGDPYFFASPAFGDINGDGRTDAVVGRADGGFDTYLGNADGSLTQLIGAANPFGGIQFSSNAVAALADFDGDGRLDLFATCSTPDSPARIFHNGGNGVFTEIASTYAYAAVYNAQYAFADFDHDGDLDAAITSSGILSYHYYDNGYLWPSSNDPLAALGIPNAKGIATFDFDYDGWMDLVVTTASNGTYAVHNNRDGSFSLLTGAANPLAGQMNGAYAVQSIDYDHDGDVDLIYAVNSNHAFQALRNDSPNGIRTAVNITPQNDAPHGADATLTLSEDGVGVLRTALFGYGDTDGDSFAGIYVTTLPASGTLYVVVGETRTAVTQGQFIDSGTVSSGRLVFFPAANANGTDQSSFTFQVVDSGPISNGGVDTDPTPNTIHFNITPVADAPVVQGVPASVNLLESTADGSHQLLLPNVTYADPDGVGGGSITVSALLAEDRVSIHNQGDAAGQIGVSGSDVRYGGVLIGSFSGGVGTAFSVTLNGAANPAAVQALLANLTYANGSDAPTEAREFRIQVVNASGHEAGIPTTFVEQTGAQNPFAAVTIGTTPVETPALGDLNGDGRLDLVIGATGGLRAYLANADGSFTLTPAAVPTITGNNLAPVFHDYDGDGDADLIVAATSAATRLFRNDGGSFTEVTGTDNPFGAIILGGVSQLSFGDVNLDGVTDFLALRTSGPTAFLARYDMQGGQYALLSSNSAPFLGTSLRAGDTIGFVDLNGDGREDAVVSGSVTGVRAFLATADGYVPTPNAKWGLPTIAGGRVVFGDIDGNGTIDMLIAKPGEALHVYSNGATTGFDMTVHVAGVNDAPVGANVSATFDEDSVYVFDFNDFGFLAVDSEGDTLTDVIINTVPAVGLLILDGVPVSAGQAIAAADILAGKLAYLPIPDAHGSFDFTFSGRDDGGTANGGHDTSASYTFTLDVTSVNDAPVVSLGAFGTGDIALDLDEGDSVLLAPEGQFTDDSPSLDGGHITLSIADGTDDDRIFIAQDGHVTVDGDTILVDGVEIGHFSGGGAEDLVVTLGTDATPAAIETLMHRVGYSSLSDAPPESRTITVTVTDSEGATSAPVTATVTIHAEDDLPQARDDVATVAENGTVIIDILHNEFDPDGGPGPVLAGIDGFYYVAEGFTLTLDSGARVTINGDGTLTYDPNGAFNWLISQDTAASTGASNSSAVDRFYYSLSDGSQAWVDITVNGVDGVGDKLVGTSGNDVITGAQTQNYFDLSGGGSDTATGGAANDGFYMGDALDAGDRLDGGGGTDNQVGLKGNINLVLGEDTLHNIQTLVMLSANAMDGLPGYTYDITMADGNVAAGQRMTINANQLLWNDSLHFDGSAETDGSFIVYAGLGDDTMIGGARGDAFFFGNDGRFDANDVVDGGAGDDQLGLRGNYTSQVVFQADSMKNIETLVLLSAYDTRYGAEGNGGFSYDLKLDDANVGSGQLLIVNGNTLRADESMAVDGSSETDGHFRFAAGAGNDTLIGGAGNDEFYGRLGADTLTGGEGNDIFFYRSVQDSMLSARDHILDFDAGDRIDLSMIDADVNHAGKDAFAFVGDADFSHTPGELRAFQSNGSWFVEGDVDGDGVADLSIHVNIANAHTLGFSDFVL